MWEKSFFKMNLMTGCWCSGSPCSPGRWRPLGTFWWVRQHEFCFWISCYTKLKVFRRGHQGFGRKGPKGPTLLKSRDCNRGPLIRGLSMSRCLWVNFLLRSMSDWDAQASINASTAILSRSLFLRPAFISHAITQKKFVLLADIFKLPETAWRFSLPFCVCFPKKEK